MRRIRRLQVSFFCAFWLACLSAGPAVCQTDNAVPIPEYYGTYAIAGGKLVDVSSPSPSATKSTEAKLGNVVGEDATFGVGAGLCRAPTVANVSTYSVPEMPSDVQFLLYAQASGMIGPMMIAQALKLDTIPYIRNVQVTGCSFSGGAPKTGIEAAWDLGFRSGSVELRLKPVPNRQDMVLAVPSSPLKAGLYLLNSKLLEALGKDFVFAVSPLSDAETANCTDLFVFTLATLGGIGRQEFRPCGNVRGPSPPSSAPQPPAAITATCSDSESCVKQGSKAFSAGSYHEAAAMWDKAVQLGGTLVNSVCWTRGLRCKPGILRLNANQISFVGSDGQTVFTAGPSEITAQVAQLSQTPYVKARVSRKNYGLFYVPEGNLCTIHVIPDCSEPGRTQQQIFADYVHQTVLKLGSGEVRKDATARDR